MIVEIQHKVILKLNPNELRRLNDGLILVVPTATVDELERADQIELRGLVV